MSFCLTREAEADIVDIYRYSVENFGEVQADTYHDGLSDCFRLLADTPLIGRDYGFLRPGLRRYEHASHSVYYRSHPAPSWRRSTYFSRSIFSTYTMPSSGMV